MSEIRCSLCEDSYLLEDIVNGKCVFCRKKEAFAAFARSCGLHSFPDPSGERYIYLLDGHLRGKKSECPDFMAELWNVLVRAKGGDKNLILR